MKNAGLIISAIGIIMGITAIVIAALKTDILCGIAVLGLFLAVIGLGIAQISNNKKS